MSEPRVPDATLASWIAELPGLSSVGVCEEYGTSRLCLDLRDARDELAAIHEATRKVLGGKCPSDEKHCTCVPLLVLANRKLRAAVLAVAGKMETAKEFYDALITQAWMPLRGESRTMLKTFAAQIREALKENADV